MTQLRIDPKDLETPGCAYCENSTYLSAIDLYVPTSEECKNCKKYDLEPKATTIINNVTGLLENLTEAEMTAFKGFETIRVLSE